MCSGDFLLRYPPLRKLFLYIYVYYLHRQLVVSNEAQTVQNLHGGKTAPELEESMKVA